MLATDRLRPEHQAGPQGPAPGVGETDPDGGCYDDLPDRAGDRQPPHGQQIGDREVQTDAEHHEHDADLRQLTGEGAIGNVARGERPDHHAGDQIADQRRQLHPLRQEPETKGESETNGDRGDQRDVVRHRSTLCSQDPKAQSAANPAPIRLKRIQQCETVGIHRHACRSSPAHPWAISRTSSASLRRAVMSAFSSPSEGERLAAAKPNRRACDRCYVGRLLTAMPVFFDRNLGDGSSWRLESPHPVTSNTHGCPGKRSGRFVGSRA